MTLPASSGAFRPPGRLVGLSLVTAALVAGILAWSSSPAGAENAILHTEQDSEAWFWTSNRDIRQCSPILSPPAPPDSYCYTTDLSATSPIAPGHLPVSLKGGESDMRSYLMFDIGDIPENSEIQVFTLELTVSRTNEQSHTDVHNQRPGGKPPATANENLAKITACLVTVPWANAEGSPPFTMNPRDPTRPDPSEPTEQNGVDCSVLIEGRPGTTWTFDLKAMAQRWVSGKSENNGIVLLPVRTAITDSWTVEFHGAEYLKTAEDQATGGTKQLTFVRKSEQAKVSVQYVPPPDEPEPPAEPPTIPPVVQEPVVQPLPEPLPTEPIAQATPEPQPQPTLGAVRPISSQPRTPWYQWLVIPAGLAGLAGLSRGMGREIGVEGGNRVAAALRRRREDRLP